MWSLGCILLELYEGRLTFDTRDTAEHLAMIERFSGVCIFFVDTRDTAEHLAMIERLSGVCVYIHTCMHVCVCVCVCVCV
jgi:hypothetical protein